MFTNVSMAGTGSAIVLLEGLLRFLGVEFPEGSVAQAVNGFLAFLGFALLVWGQLRRKDLKFGLLRK